MGLTLIDRYYFYCG